MIINIAFYNSKTAKKITAHQTFFQAQAALLGFVKSPENKDFTEEVKQKINTYPDLLKALFDGKCDSSVNTFALPSVLCEESAS
jgi:hypothetical protein